MTKEEHVKVMGYAGVIYRKEFTPLEINAWYEFFKDIPYDICKGAIKTCAIKYKYMPSISELLLECREADMKKRMEILYLMYQDGYFKRGVEELTDEHAETNYTKAQLCIARDIIPDWLLEDMISYGYTNVLIPTEVKQITTQKYLLEG